MINPPSAVRHPPSSARPDSGARDRLLGAGLRLFADRGFKATSVRELAREAEVNVAAISYHFGDKAALYRAIFSTTVREQPGDRSIDLLSMPLDQAMQVFYRDFLEPLKHDENARLMMKLHYRELFEPTGAWQQVVEQEIRPQFKVLCQLLQRALGLSRVDRDVHRAALAMVGMAVHLFTCQNEVRTLAPGVLGASRSIDVLAERMAGYACAIVEGERARRAREPQAPDSGRELRGQEKSSEPRGREKK